MSVMRSEAYGFLHQVIGSGVKVQADQLPSGVVAPPNAEWRLTSKRNPAIIFYVFIVLNKVYVLHIQGIIKYYDMNVWISARNDINFSMAAGLIRLHMPGVKWSRV